MILAAAGIAMFANEIVRVAFQRGAFDVESLQLTSGPLLYYALGMAFHAVYTFQMRLFYARRALIQLGVILLALVGVKIILSMALQST